MLVLSRRIGESVEIGSAKVIISRVAGNRVTLAIEAPKSVQIVRTELAPLPRVNDGRKAFQKLAESPTEPAE